MSAESKGGKKQSVSYSRSDNYKSSSRGFKTPYYESKGWSASESHSSSGSGSLLGGSSSSGDDGGFFTSSEAFFNRVHESHMAYDARHTYERQKNADRDADLEKAALAKGYVRKQHDFGDGLKITSYKPLPGLLEERGAARRHEVNKIAAKGAQDARLASISAKSAARTQKSNTFRLFLQNLFQSRQDRRRIKAHKRSIKQSAKEQRRTIAMQRGYW